MKNKVVVLLSGGLDSAVVAAVVKRDGEAHALTVRYGQRHEDLEVSAAHQVANALRLNSHLVVDMPLWLLARGASSLVDTRLAVPVGGLTEGIPSTYVPARNLILLSLAMCYAESIGANHVAIGVNAVDYSGYPDCRGDFLASFENTARLATKVGREGSRVRISAPLLSLSKKQIVQTAMSLKVPVELTHSCYQPVAGVPCHVCDSCRIRDAAILEAGA